MIFFHQYPQSSKTWNPENHWLWICRAGYKLCDRNIRAGKLSTYLQCQWSVTRWLFKVWVGIVGYQIWETADAQWSFQQ